MPAVSANLQAESLIPAVGSKGSRAVFVDGAFSGALSRVASLPRGVELSAKEGASELTLNLFDKVSFDETFWIFFLGTKDSVKRAAQITPKIHVNAGISTRLNLVIGYKALEALPGNNFSAQTEIFLAENACVDYFQFEENSASARTCFKNSFFLKKHASVDGFVYTGGGQNSRYETIVELNEPHAFASFKGLSLLAGKNQVIHDIRVIHRASQGISRQYYKNILYGEARSEYLSLVQIEKDAFKSDSEQLSRNLVLSPKASMHSRPQLRIDHDDVAARHGSATGELSEHEIFYLQSRGISKNEAKALLVYGFAEEIVSEITEHDLRSYLEARLVKDLKNFSEVKQ